MIGLLIKETVDAYFLDEEQENVFRSYFARKGMDIIDFMRFVGAAKRREIKKGEKLVTQGCSHDQVFFILAGSCAVFKNNVKVAKLKPNNFVGEMAFVRWVSKRKELDDGIHDDSDRESLDTMRVGSADVTASEDCVVYAWSHDTLRAILQQYKSLSSIFEQILSIELNLKVTAQTTYVAREGKQKALDRYSLILSGTLLRGEVTAQERAALADIRNSSCISDADHFSILGQLGWTAQEFQEGKKMTVTTQRQVANKVAGLIENLE